MTDSNVTAIVGEKIGLTCGLDSGAPSITDYSWTVPGKTFSNWVADAESAVLYTDFPKNNSGVNFYWIDKGSKQVSCDITVKGEKLTAKTTFNILRPTAQITTQGGSVTIDTDAGGMRLHCGVGDDPTGTVGIMFNVANLTFPFPPEFAGNTNINWFQVKTSQLRREQASSGQWKRKQGSNLCDTTCPYDFDVTCVYPRTQDSPYSETLGNYIGVDYSDSFDMWLMYQPNGGQWVPLQKVSWHWDGAGNWNGTNWVMTSHHDPGSPSGSDTTTHPAWTGNVTDLQWQFE